ncbi:hypothetical protein ACFYO2_00845 [Streptomyces sp. NPDC006602]|uniref:hypothetical protein n=1 Tax=Streptomyces sp. NPDC006602 TaxID=3364751 RepID=UPI0036A3CB54
MCTSVHITRRGDPRGPGSRTRARRSVIRRSVRAGTQQGGHLAVVEQFGRVGPHRSAEFVAVALQPLTRNGVAQPYLIERQPLLPAAGP